MIEANRTSQRFIFSLRTNEYHPNLRENRKCLQKKLFTYSVQELLLLNGYTQPAKKVTVCLCSVSESVINEAKEVIAFEDLLSDVTTDGINDIEHYISLIESVHTKKYFNLVEFLRSSFCKNIQNNLQFNGAPTEPNITKALLEMHTAITDEEVLTGAICVNYDNLLDRAFFDVYKGLNYAIKCTCENANYVINEKCLPFSLILEIITPPICSITKKNRQQRSQSPLPAQSTAYRSVTQIDFGLRNIHWAQKKE